MASHRYINTKFWTDSYISDLDPTQKYLFLYFLTNPLTNIAGIYEISLKQISFDTGIKMKAVNNILKKFKKDKKITYIDSWIIIANFPKHQEYNRSPLIKTGIETILDKIPQSIRYRLNTLSIPYTYPLNYLNSNLNLNLNKNKNTNPSSFKKREDGKKPYYNDLEVRDVKGKLWCIPKEGGQWLEFNGNKKDIVYK